MKIYFSWQILKKYLDIKFYGNPSAGAKLLHDEAYSRFSQFYELA